MRNYALILYYLRGMSCCLTFSEYAVVIKVSYYVLARKAPSYVANVIGVLFEGTSSVSTEKNVFSWLHITLTTPSSRNVLS